MSLIRKHVAVLQAWACLALVYFTICSNGDDTLFRGLIYKTSYELS